MLKIPTYNAAPLSKTFFALRILQLLSLVAVITLSSLFVSDIHSITADLNISSSASAKLTTPTLPTSAFRAPPELIATLTLAALAMFYTLLSLPFYWAQITKGLLYMCLADALLSGGFAIVAWALGKTLGGGVDCFAVRSGTTNALGASAGNNVLGYLVRAEKDVCFEVMTIWVVGAALSAMFLASALLLPALFARQKRALKVAAKGSV